MKKFWSLFHYGLFLASFASNFAVLYKVPLNLGQPFYSTYSIANTASSLLITLVFTWIAKSNQIKKYTILILLSTFLLGWWIGGLIGIAVIYPLAMLCSDYSVSQAKIIKCNTAYRLTMVLTSILFVIPTLSFQSAILLRIGASMLFYTYILFREKEMHALKIKSPIAFMIFAYFFYSGTLMVIPWLSNSDVNIKVWFLTAQISLGILLKRADFLTRGSYKTSFIVNLFTYLFASFVVIFASTYSFNLIYLALVIISSIGLIFATDRLLIKSEEKC